MSDLFSLLDKMYSGGEDQATSSPNGINSLYDKLVDAQKEVALAEEGERLRSRMSKSREDYRAERMAEWMPKSKWGKAGLGIVEFLSGLGGKPGMIGQQRALINQDYDNQQENDRAALQLYKTDAGIYDQSQKRQLSLARAKMDQLIADNKIDLKKAELNSIDTFRKAQTDIANRKLDQAEEFNQLLSMYKLAQIKAIQEKKNLGGFGGFLEYMVNSGKFTAKEAAEYGKKYATKMSSFAPQFDTMTQSNPAGTIRVTTKKPRGAFDKVNLETVVNN